ncbi:serine hydrolase [Patescibacteria group bacterium]|nr:serine hydrolase [Patescibacteria group bacterium]
MLLNFLKIIGCIVFLLALNFLLPAYGRHGQLNMAAVSMGVEQNAENAAPLNLEAKSACVFDLVKNRFVFELNKDIQLPLASLAKLMTAAEAKENLLPTTLVEISKEALLMEGDSGLAVGETWRLPDILKIMLISSSNDAAYAIASSLSAGLKPDDSEFVGLMNKKARELGLEQAYFLNATGLDISKEIAGAAGSCSDITKLIVYILKEYPELLEATTKEIMILNGKEFKNTNKLLPNLPVLLGSKTGFSDLAGGNLIVVVDKGLGYPMILTVLGSSLDGRFSDVQTLYDRFVK